MAFRGGLSAALLLAAVCAAPAHAGDHGVFRTVSNALPLLLADQSVTLNSTPYHYAVNALVRGDRALANGSLPPAKLFPLQTLFARRAFSLDRTGGWTPSAMSLDMSDFDRLPARGFVPKGSEVLATRIEAARLPDPHFARVEMDPGLAPTDMNRWIAAEQARTYPVAPRYRPTDPLKTMLVISVRSDAAPIVGLGGPGIAAVLWNVVPRLYGNDAAQSAP